MELDWTVREYLGGSVRKVLDGKVLEGLLTEVSDLQNGDKVEVYGFVFDVIGNEGALSLKSGKCTGRLSFNEDDRHCWVCTGIVNGRG